MNLYNTGLYKFYRDIEALGDPLTGISERIDFERIRPILSDLYENNTDRGGRPNYDPILIVKILLLQQWYNLSDPQIEREIRDRISFLNFLTYPQKLPDRNTIWYFRERLSKTGKDRLAFNEIRDLIMEKYIRIIEKLSLTPTNVHDSKIDLSIPGIICYRDKGYFGAECKGINGTMDRVVRRHPLPIKSIPRNLRISRIRSMVEHPYAFFKRMFHFDHVMVTTVKRVRVQTYSQQYVIIL